MEDYTICTQVDWLDHFLEQKLYFSMMASNSEGARLFSGDGFSVSLPAQLLLAASKLSRKTFIPGQTMQDVFLPSVRGSTLLLLVEILRAGRTSSMGTMDNMGYMLKEVQEAMELLEIPGCTSLMRVDSKPSKFSEQAEAKSVKIIAPPSMIHLAIEELPHSITPVVEVTQMTITSDSLEENTSMVSEESAKINVKSEPTEELSGVEGEVNEQVKENVLPRQCHVCNKQFTKRKNLLMHIRRVHREIMFSCENCDMKFVSEFNLKKHIKSHIEQVKENMLPRDCNICKKQFMKRSNLLEHFRRVHREVLFSCESCDMKFVSELSLKRHVKSHEGNRIHCQFCKKQFMKRSNLFEHFKRVHREDLFSCESCDKKFVTEFSLKRHVKSHEGNRIHCQFCLTTFKSKELWYRHMRKSHRGELFPCQECDKKFVLEASLKAHVKSCHLGIPFQCIECPATFSKKSSMQVHLRNVHSGVVLVCEHCRETFSHNGSLRRHMRNVHKQLLDLTDQCGEQFDMNENKKNQDCPNKESGVQ